MTSITEIPQEIKIQSPEYFRCPGCFAWTLQLNAIYYPPNSLDDWWDYDLCPRCDQVIKTGDYESVYDLTQNIRHYAGFSDEADTI